MVASALFLLAALSSSFFTLVHAVAPFPLVPNNNVLVAGTTVKIGWNAATDPGWSSMKVELMGGSNYVMNPLMTLGENENGMADGSVELNVPCITPYGQYYFVRFTSSDNTVTPNYSTRFVIQSSTGETDPAPNPIQPNGDPIPWANGTIVPCSGSSSTSTSSTSTSTGTSKSSTGTSTSTGTSSTSTGTSTSTDTSSIPTSTGSNTDPGTEPTSSGTGPASSGGRSTSVVITPTTSTAVPTPAPTGGSSESGTVTVTVTTTVTKWGRHPPGSATRMTTKWSTSTSSSSTSTSTSTQSTSTGSSPTPSSNADDFALFTVAPQTKTKATNGAASMKVNLGIVAVFVGVGALLC